MPVVQLANLPLKGYVMEKRRAHYDLRAIQAQMATVVGLRMTVTARHDALRAGITLQTAVAVIQALNQRCFYKSMTTHQDHGVWQDVYHGLWRGKSLYIKFQQDAAGYFTISFKEL
jgi:motility quorum-sensing regulator/GCU-specific mRNA interferase toxin